MRTRGLLPLALTSAATLCACSNSSTPVGIDVTTGQETNAFSEAAVTSVSVNVKSPIDSTLDITETTSPDGGTFDFGTIANTEQITIDVTGYTAGSQPVMAGSSLAGILLSAVIGTMPVFIQQRSQWARPPGGFECAHVGGVASVEEDRAFILTGGKIPSGSVSGCASSGIDSYDMFGLGGDVPISAFGDVPTTIVSLLPSDNSADSQGLFISASSGTFWDYVTGEANTACPAGFSDWAGVSSGAAIAGDSGVWWVVGATRSSGATASVLEVGADCTTSGFTLNAPRAGAAAAWIEGVGLVVAGGQAKSTTGPGLEILEAGELSAGGTSFTAYCESTPDPVVGASIVSESGGILILGGVDGTAPAPARHFDTTSVSSSCTPEIYTTAPGATPMPTLTNTSAFQLSNGSALLVGTDETGMTSTVIVDFSSPPNLIVTPAPLREPRRGGVPIVGPTAGGAIAMLGGEHADGTPATSIELFVP